MLRVWNVERNRISSQANMMKNLQRVKRFVDLCDLFTGSNDTIPITIFHVINILMLSLSSLPNFDFYARPFQQSVREEGDIMLTLHE